MTGTAQDGRSWTEAERLAALHRTGLLDTPPEQAFDDLVRLAADIVGVPIAAVHLVDEDRQWGKAEVGLGVRDLPRSGSFCPTAMLEPEGLVVPDATKDPRFADSPLVTGGPGIRFYAGVPLLAEGLPIGALCVIGTSPRPEGLTGPQRFALKALAAQAGSLVALRRALAERREADALRQQTLDSASDVAIVSSDLAGRITGWSRGAENTLGWTEAEMLGQAADRLFTPEDRAAGVVEEEMRTARERDRNGKQGDGKERAGDERWHLRRDGTRFWASGEMMPLRDEAGRRTGYLKVLRDRTERHLAGQALETAERAVRASEAQLAAIFDQAAVGLSEIGPDGRFIRVNGELCRILGATREALEGGASFLAPEAGALRQEGAPDGRLVVDRAYRRRDGTVVQTSSTLTRLAGGQDDGRDDGGTVLAVTADLTAQHAAEASVRASEARLNALVSASSDAVFSMTPDWGSMLQLSAAGRFLASVPGHNPRWLEQCIPPEDRDAVQAAIAVAVRDRAPLALLHQVRTTAGGLGWAQSRAIPVLDEAGLVTEWFGTALDVTRRQETQRHRDALLELADQLRSLQDPHAMVMAASAILGRTLHACRGGFGTVDAVAETVVIAADWCDGPGVDSIAGLHAFRAFGSYIDDLMRGEVVAIPDVAQDGRTQAGAARFAAIQVRALLNVPLMEGGRLVAVVLAQDRAEREWGAEEIGFARAVADRTWAALRQARAEEDLRSVNAMLEQQVTERTADRNRLWRMSRDLMLIAAFDGTILTVNPAWTAALGWTIEDLLGRSLLDLVHPDDLERTIEGSRAISEGTEFSRFENRYRRADGSHAAISWTAGPADGVIVAVGRDVTLERDQAEALQRSEDLLRQSQKMEAVGQLTGGIAHDFNNLLTGITGSLELLSTRVAQGRVKDLDRYVGAAQGAARRAASLTHRLLAFSRRQTLDPKPTDMNRLVQGMEELIRRTIGPSVELGVVGAAGLWPTLVDPSQLENALLNLCINARDAMPGGGRLTIETANRWIDEHAGRTHELPPGQFVSLCVSDTGTGMTKDVIAKAFDPFFTTKPLGHGTGLGLSMIYGFARQSGGQARIYSEVGQGTMVCLYLPRHLGEAEPSEAVPELSGVRQAGRGETVLVVDDEPTVRMLVVEVLQELGYAAIEAADGPAGLRVLQSGARVALVVTDVGLPGGMNGRQMADAARVGRPGLKVLFITGYAENAVVGDGHLEPGMHVMTKPFAMEALAGRIRELIAP